jgi:hypothetical protein
MDDLKEIEKAFDIKLIETDGVIFIVKLSKKYLKYLALNNIDDDFVIILKAGIAYKGYADSEFDDAVKYIVDFLNDDMEKYPVVFNINAQHIQNKLRKIKINKFKE